MQISIGRVRDPVMIGAATGFTETGVWFPVRSSLVPYNLFKSMTTLPL